MCMCTGSPIIHAPDCFQIGVCKTWMWMNYQQRLAYINWWQTHEYNSISKNMENQSWYNNMNYSDKNRCSSFLNSIKSKPTSQNVLHSLSNAWKIMPDQFKSYLESEATSDVQQLLSFISGSVGNFQ